jgi:hypothetical protein
MQYVTIITTAGPEQKDGTFEAEISISLHNAGVDDDKHFDTTEQRVVSKGHDSRQSANNAAVEFVERFLFPKVRFLPKANL